MGQVVEEAVLQGDVVDSEGQAATWSLQYLYAAPPGFDRVLGRSLKRGQAGKSGGLPA